MFYTFIALAGGFQLLLSICMETRVLSPSETREEEHFKVMEVLWFSCGKFLSKKKKSGNFLGTLNINTHNHPTHTDTPSLQVYWWNIRSHVRVGAVAHSHSLEKECRSDKNTIMRCYQAQKLNMTLLPSSQIWKSPRDESTRWRGSTNNLLNKGLLSLLKFVWLSPSAFSPPSFIYLSVHLLFHQSPLLTRLSSSTWSSTCVCLYFASFPCMFQTCMCCFFIKKKRASMFLDRLSGFFLTRSPAHPQQVSIMLLKYLQGPKNSPMSEHLATVARINSLTRKKPPAEPHSCWVAICLDRLGEMNRAQTPLSQLWSSRDENQPITWSNHILNVPVIFSWPVLRLQHFGEMFWNL